MRTSLTALGAKVCPFRHGGDELSFVVVGGPGTGSPGLEAAVRQRLEEASRLAREEYAHLRDVPHPKHPGDRSRWGTGIVFGTAVITDPDPAAIVAVADGEIERRKAGAPQT